MAADKKPIIVVKKITIAGAGHHGGSWKVAFADFMTAMMAFFLVMWLVNQSEEVKKSVSDYFSTPSIIEYNFANYGVELTLEKLFLDLMNQPLKALEQFITPVDRLPNIMDMGTKRIQVHFLTEKIGEFATQIEVNQDEITFEISDEKLFLKDSAKISAFFVDIMERIKGITEGLKDSDIFINSELPITNRLPSFEARNVAEERLDIVMAKIEASLQGQNVDLFGKTTVETISPAERRKTDRGTFKFKIIKKDMKSESEKLDERNKAREARRQKTLNREIQNSVKSASARTVQSQDSKVESEPDEVDVFADQLGAPSRRRSTQR